MESNSEKSRFADGRMMKAVLDMFYATGDDKYFAYVRDYMDCYISEDGNLFGYDIDADRLNSFGMGKPLFDLLNITGSIKYKKAINLLYSGIAKHPITKSGIFWHKKTEPNQVRLNSLYMVLPFYAEYDAIFNQNKNYKDVFRQFKKVYEIMRDSSTGLYFHGYDESKDVFWADCETGLSQNFCTTACGYYAMALVDTIAKLDERFFYEYMTLQSYLKELLDALWVYNDAETRLFFQVTNEGGREGNYLETSGSCAIAYTFMKGARMGYLPTYYFNYGKEIYESVAEHKFDGSNLNDICRAVGLGGKSAEADQSRDGSYAYYVTLPKVSNIARGLAPFISAYAETLRG